MRRCTKSSPYTSFPKKFTKSVKLFWYESSSGDSSSLRFQSGRSRFASENVARWSGLVLLGLTSEARIGQRGRGAMISSDPQICHTMISSPGSSLEFIRYSQEYLNHHVTFAPPRVGRPDGAGWLARRVQTGRRVKLPEPMVREWYEPCTFEHEQWVLFDEHFLHTSGTMRRRPRDGRSGLPSTTLDHVSVTQ